VDAFIRRQNVVHYRQLLEAVTDENEKQRILKVTRRRKAETKDAGDKDVLSQLI